MVYIYVHRIILGKVFSSCKLFVSGSVLDDLGDRTPVNSPERSCCIHTYTHKQTRTQTHRLYHFALAVLNFALLYISDLTLV